MSIADSPALGTRISRGVLGVCGLGVLVAAVATTSLAHQLWAQPSPPDMQGYTTALAIHGAVLPGVLSPTAAMAVIVPLVITAKPRRSAVPILLALVGVVAWLVAWLLPALHPDTSWTFAPAPLWWPTIAASCNAAAYVAFGAALGITVVADLRTTPATRSLTTAAWAITAWIAATFAVLAILAWQGDPGARVLSEVRTATMFWGLLVSVALAAMAMATLEDMRVPSPAIAFVALGVFPAFIGERVLGRLTAFIGVDVHLSDTYFEVGREHLALGAAPAAMLAALHLFDVRVLGRKARPLLAWPGAVLMCGGLLAQAIAMMVLGSRGMPRRYPVFPPEFADAFQWVIGTGIIAGVGALLVVAAWLFAPRSNASAPT